MTQSSLVASMLQDEVGLKTELVVIETTGDREQSAPAREATWSMGSFVGELELALLDRRVDLAVHSYKDMPTADTEGLRVAAVPERAAAHDVLVCASNEIRTQVLGALADGPVADGLTVGTSSPRRSAQLRKALGCKIEPIRGNVPTRFASVGGVVDIACLAAAGLDRLGLKPEHTVPLELHRFPIAAAQGALAIQTRVDASFVDAVASVDHKATRSAVEAERTLLRTIEAGCHTAVGAFACLHGRSIHLVVEYHNESGGVLRVEERGGNAEKTGIAAGERVLQWLREQA